MDKLYIIVPTVVAVIFFIAILFFIVKKAYQSKVRKKIGKAGEKKVAKIIRKFARKINAR